MQVHINGGMTALMNETLNGIRKILEHNPSIHARASEKIEWKHCTFKDDCPHDSMRRCFIIAGKVALKRDSGPLEFSVSGTRHEMLVGLSGTTQQWAPVRLDVVVNIPDNGQMRPVGRQFDLTPAQG